MEQIFLIWNQSLHTSAQSEVSCSEKHGGKRHEESKSADGETKTELVLLFLLLLLELRLRFVLILSQTMVHDLDELLLLGW